MNASLTLKRLIFFCITTTALATGAGCSSNGSSSAVSQVAVPGPPSAASQARSVAAVKAAVAGGESAYPSGTAWPLPGTIDFDNYDIGGEGVGYHTHMTTNPTGKYRTDGVGIEPDGDTNNGNGFDVGWNTNGNWYKYSVNVQTAGTYPVALRVAANAAGSLHIEDELGNNLTGAIAIVPSGGFQAWTTVGSTMALTAGAHILKVSIDSGNGSFNINDMLIGNPPPTPVPASETAYPNGVAWAIPGTVDFDNYDRGGEGVGYHTGMTTNPGGKYRTDGVGIEPDGDTNNGNGFDVGWNANGNWYKYSVNVQTAGTYPVALRIAANGTGTLHIEDESGKSLTGEVAIARSGGFQAWTNVQTTMTLAAGAHILKVSIDSGNGGFNLNDMVVGTPSQQASPQPTAPPSAQPTARPSAQPTLQPTATPVTNESAFPNGVPWTVPGTVDFDNYDRGGEGVGYHTLNATNQGGKYRTDGVSIEPDGDANNGNGFDVGWNANGDWYKYSVNVLAPGTYPVAFRLAANNLGTFHLEDETGANLTGTVQVPATGGFQAWATFTSSVTLRAGNHAIKMVIDSGNGSFNLNDMTIGTPVPTPAPSAQPVNSSMQLPTGFYGEVIANIGGARELAALPNGDLLVGTGGSNVMIVPNAEGAGQPGAPNVFVSVGEASASGITLGPDNNVYIGSFTHAWKSGYTPGAQTGTPAQIVATFRQGPVGQTGGDLHRSTSVAANNQNVFISIGSSCDACTTEVDPTRASIQQIPLGGGAMTTLATRIRNAIAITVNPATGVLWAGGAGQDNLTYTHPYEYMDAVTAHAGVPDYGWPVCSENQNAFGSGADCSHTVIPRVEFPAYATHIGAIFYPANQTGAYTFPASYLGGLFVSSHGSWHCCPSTIPRVAFVPMNGDQPVTAVNWSDPTVQWQPFLFDTRTNSTTSSNYQERFTGVAVGSQGSLFVADDKNGLIYRVRPISARPTASALRRSIGTR